MHEAVLADVLPGELHRLHRGLRHRARRAPASDAAAWRATRAGPGSPTTGPAAGDYDAALAPAVRAGRAPRRPSPCPRPTATSSGASACGTGPPIPRRPPACDRDELLAAAADAASRSGLTVRALTLVDEALATPPVADDPVRAGLLHERRGWYLYRTGRADDALAAYELAVELVPAKPPTAARARVVQAHAHALVRAGRAEAARPGPRRRSRWPARWPTASTRARPRTCSAWCWPAEGRTDEAIAQLHEAGQIAAELGDLAEVAGAYVHLWRTLVEAGRGDDLVDLVLGFDTSAAGVASAPRPRR